jgi:hypothetical protein
MKRMLNSIRLNTVFLNGIVAISKKTQGGGGGDTPDVPDVPDEPDVPSIPEGYEDFFSFDGAFLAADGEFYVKL